MAWSIVNTPSSMKISIYSGLTIDRCKFRSDHWQILSWPLECCSNIISPPYDCVRRLISIFCGSYEQIYQLKTWMGTFLF